MIYLFEGEFKLERIITAFIGCWSTVSIVTMFSQLVGFSCAKNPLILRMQDLN